MDSSIRKLLLTELNVVTYIPGKVDEISDESMVLAVTANGNLHSLGYTLKPEAIVKLAASPSLMRFYDDVKEVLPDVNADPMYPNFPTQVMTMDAATFRLHQMIHYLSTYGVEDWLGINVSRGWLPDAHSTEKIKEDTKLLELTVLDLIEEEASYGYALKKLLERRQRLVTIPEKELVENCLEYVSSDELSALKITFKENLDDIFDMMFEKDREECIRVLSVLCQNSGDVFKNIQRLLSKKKYHFKTSEKKTLVRLLETYPIADFTANLMRSAKNREKILLILERLDYNQYSKSPAHKEAVAKLRNKELVSWHSVATQKLLEKQPDALAFIAKHPGEYLRMINWMLSLDYQPEEILDAIKPYVGKLSTQTIVTVLNGLDVMVNETSSEDFSEEDLEAEIKSYLPSYRLSKPEYAPFDSFVQFAEEHGLSTATIELYTRSLFSRNYYRGMKEFMCQITEEMRFRAKRERQQLRRQERKELEQWAPEKWGKEAEQKAIDDLYASYEEKFRFMGKTDLKHLDDLARICIAIEEEWPGECVADPDQLYTEPFADRDPEVRKMKKMYAKYVKCRRQMRLLEEKLGTLKRSVMEQNKEELEKKIQEIHRKFAEMRVIADRETSRIHEKYDRAYEALKEKTYNSPYFVDRRQEMYRSSKETIMCMYHEMVRFEKKRNALAARYAVRLRRSFCATNRETLKSIFEKLLEEKLKAVKVEGFTGLKVYPEYTKAIIPEYSKLSINDKAAEGGYVCSGIAYKIPEAVKRLRFFVYWNDSERVDIDLHANAVSLKNQNIHVGWNGDYNNYGIVHSGDITHSDAAEYIDIDLTAPIKRVDANIHLYHGPATLANVDECYVGMMAVDSLGCDVQLYNRANCFFSHEIKQEVRGMKYGYIDVQKRFLIFEGQNEQSAGWAHETSEKKLGLTLKEYMDVLFKAQQIQLVDNAEDADVILTLGKCEHANGISLIDENFFMDAV